MFQATNESTILQCVKQVGPAPGAKQMLTWEFKHAQEAIESGIYVTWACDDQSKGDCFRVGSQSNCFCGHRFSSHELILKKGQKTNCKDCKCAAFRFIPRRPEEVGQWHLPRRKGFDVNVWRPSCQCKHTHEQHNPTKPHKCKACGCGSFVSDFCCINCDMKFEDHFTVYELEHERKAAGKAIRDAYMPLANSPEIQYETMKKLKLDGRTDEERMLEEMKLGDQEEEKQLVLNIQEDGAGGIASRPQVQLVINARQNFAPKQNLAKPEKSIQIMQQRGMAGLGTKKTVAGGTTGTTGSIKSTTGTSSGGIGSTSGIKAKTTTTVPKAGGFIKSSVPKKM